MSAIDTEADGEHSINSFTEMPPEYKQTEVGDF